MKKFKFLSCIGLLALVCLVAMPPGAVAFDGADNFSIENQNTIALAVDDISAYVDVAVAPTAIANGLRSGFKALKFENGETRKHLLAWNGEGGDATPYSRALHPS